MLTGLIAFNLLNYILCCVLPYKIIDPVPAGLKRLWQGSEVKSLTSCDCCQQDGIGAREGKKRARQKKDKKNASEEAAIPEVEKVDENAKAMEKREQQEREKETKRLIKEGKNDKKLLTSLLRAINREKVMIPGLNKSAFMITGKQKTLIQSLEKFSREEPMWWMTDPPPTEPDPEPEPEAEFDWMSLLGSLTNDGRFSAMVADGPPPDPATKSRAIGALQRVAASRQWQPDDLLPKEYPNAAMDTAVPPLSQQAAQPRETLVGSGDQAAGGGSFVSGMRAGLANRRHMQVRVGSCIQPAFTVLVHSQWVCRIAGAVKCTLYSPPPQSTG